MNGFAERMREAMELSDITVSELAEMTGIAKSSISRYVRGIMLPKQNYTDLIARALHVSPGYLITGVRQKSTLNNSYPYPVIPQGVSAGQLESMESVQTFSSVDVPDVILGRYARRKGIVFMHVNGESMNNVIENGSLIVVQTGIEKENLKNGDIVIASNGGEYTVKRFYNDEQNRRIILRPDSSDLFFLPIVISYEDAGDFRIFGKVVIYQVTL